MARLLAAVLLAPLLLPATEDDGFKPLFDGRTLDGWVPVNAAPGTFSVKDGTLVTTTYGHWEQGEAPYIVSVRFTLAELDAKRTLLAPSP